MLAYRVHHRAQLVVTAAAGAAPAPLVRGPPPAYDHRSLQQASRDLARSAGHPELLPLVEDGTLVALRRPEGYAERCSDGYQEPLEVWLVGTAHVSQRSAEAVRRVVQVLQPDAVVVELCRSRQAVMYAAPAAGGAQQQQAQQGQGHPGAALRSAGGGGSSDEEDSSGSRGAASNPLSLSGGALLPAFQRSMELGGASALLLRLVLGRLSASMAGSAGLRTGGEFVAARQEAEALGAQLVLGDRPIEITLQRAWDALPWARRAELGAALASGAAAAGRAPMDEAAIEALKDDDAVSLLFAQLSAAYPELVGPLISERDLYLAWSLKRSKAVNGARRVVGVVGKGHLRGVCYALTHDAAGADLRFRDLVGGKNVKADRKRQRAAAVGRFAAETALLGLLWWAWTELLQPQLQL